MTPFFSKRRRSMRKVIFFLSSLMMKKGWFDLASARHSMGTLRINSTLLDLKDHSAASTLQVTDQEEYLVDMGALNCLLPTDQPRLSEHMDDIIKMIEKIIENDCGYVMEGGDVFFSVDKSLDYGKLSGQRMEHTRASERESLDYGLGMKNFLW
ncbi:PREDICTED: cysteine--tRNA ligase 2, cytoplasmic-like [Brassica oleracea var. oleracea]|uniref:cysteine--tRNA ligase 2, cytoplasmic-like n=1 Tax=Brassica oleracea var. oleracea TaxID=109376 RepID=UPI0006A6B792|nr:PREDICTED: cysteine--tRNA ligase 2, cytoplasmic-like [Brassica oleracea var. oleracea]